MNEHTALKSKTLIGVLWSFADMAANHGLQFIIQIILARLLLPEQFGLIGMILVFIAISNSVVDSGFTQALIRDQQTTQVDYSTVFYFNVFMACVMYGLLYISSTPISVFFGESELVPMLRILSLVLIINSLGIIQRVLLIKKVDFKTITKVNVIAVIVSGSITIVFAVRGYGVWSLVINIISMQIIQTTFLWIFNKWIPSWKFNIQSFKKYYKFGYKLLLSGLLDTIYNNIFLVIIGRIYSTSQLGFYTTAVRFRDMASQSISASVQRVSYPVLSSMQEDEKRLKNGFRKIIKTTAFINFPLMIGLAAIAFPLFNILFGEQWKPSVIYFQLLCLAGMLYPIHAVNLNILQVKGRSDLFLKLEIIKKAVLTLFIVLSLLFGLGIIGLIVAAVVNSFIALLINTHYSAREINYSMKDQMKDLLPIFLISVVMGAIVYSIGNVLLTNDVVKIIIQIILGLLIYITVTKFAKIQELNELFYLVLQLFKKMKMTFLPNR